MEFNKIFQESDNLTITIDEIQNKKIPQICIEKILKVVDLMNNFKNKRYASIEKEILDILGLKSFERVNFNNFVEITCKHSCEDCGVVLICKNYGSRNFNNEKTLFKVYVKKEMNKEIMYIFHSNEEEMAEHRIVKYNFFAKRLLPYLKFFVKYRMTEVK